MEVSKISWITGLIPLWLVGAEVFGVIVNPYFFITNFVASLVAISKEGRSVWLFVLSLVFSAIGIFLV